MVEVLVVDWSQGGRAGGGGTVVNSHMSPQEHLVTAGKEVYGLLVR